MRAAYMSFIQSVQGVSSSKGQSETVPSPESSPEREENGRNLDGDFEEGLEEMKDGSGFTMPPKETEKGTADRTAAKQCEECAQLATEEEPQVVQRNKQWSYDEAPAIYKPAAWMRNAIGAAAVCRKKIVSRAFMLLEI